MSLRVLVLGAGGYIGDGVARALRRAGLIVYGVVRNESQKAHLLKHEIIPVIGSLDKPEELQKFIEQCPVIIDAAGIKGASRIFFEYVRNVKVHTIHNYKTLYIFTSGIMTYYPGFFETALLPKSETLEPFPTDPVEMAPKKQLENDILSTTSLRPVVIRPGFVYGGHGGVILPLFFDVKTTEKELELVGSPVKRWSWVHVDDLGEAYVRVIKSGSVVDHQVFNISDQDNPTYQELKVACAEAAGWKGTVKVVPVPEEAERMKKWETNVIISPQKAYDLLGWRPSHIGVLNETDIYYQAWLASKNDRTGN